jgi:hypothetical protein
LNGIIKNQKIIVDKDLKNLETLYAIVGNGKW